jgi:tetratricopeptide (TPR) repeat protein
LAYGAVAILAIYAIGLAWLAWADWHLQRSVTAEHTGNLSAAVTQAHQAVVLDPFSARPLFRLAWLEGKLAQQTGDLAARQAAIEHYRAGLNLEPIWGLNSANLAGLLWQPGQPDEAIAILQRTLTAEKDSLYLVNLGYFYEQMGRWDDAVTAYGQALWLSPALAGSGFWQAAPERVQRWPNLAAAAVSFARDEVSRQQLQVDLALARQEFETVESLIDPVAARSTPTLRVALVEAYLKRGQLEQAAALLKPNEPESAQEFRLWGQLKLLSGDLPAAEKLLKTAIFLGDGSAYYFLGQLYQQQGQLKAAEAAYRRGFSPHYSAENIEMTIYGRPGGNDLLTPPLLRIGVSPTQAAPWLALARLYESEQRFDEAKQIYEFLLFEDSFLTQAQVPLKRLEKTVSP